MAVSERTCACGLRGKLPELARLLLHRIVHILHDFSHEKIARPDHAIRFQIRSNGEDGMKKSAYLTMRTTTHFMVSAEIQLASMYLTYPLHSSERGASQ